MKVGYVHRIGKTEALSTALDCQSVHPGELTWNLKITYLKMKVIFQTCIFGFHVNL